MEVERIVSSHPEVLEAAAVGSGRARARRRRTRSWSASSRAAAAGPTSTPCSRSATSACLLRGAALRAGGRVAPQDPDRACKGELRDAGITADTTTGSSTAAGPVAVSDDELDLGEAADYILSERPGWTRDAVWAVLNELGAPPARGREGLAFQLLASARPDVPARDAPAF